MLFKGLNNKLNKVNWENMDETLDVSYIKFYFRETSMLQPAF